MTVTTFQDEDILKFWDDILSSDTYRLKLAEIRISIIPTRILRYIYSTNPTDA